MHSTSLPFPHLLLAVLLFLDYLKVQLFVRLVFCSNIFKEMLTDCLDDFSNLFLTLLFLYA